MKETRKSKTEKKKKNAGQKIGNKLEDERRKEKNANKKNSPLVLGHVIVLALFSLDCICIMLGLPGGSAVKSLPALLELKETWVRSLGWGRSPGRGRGNPLQYSCMENPMGRGACWVTVHRVTKSQT